MFERFRAAFAARLDGDSAASSAWRDGRFAGVGGYAEFVAEFGGASFGGGLYRVHDAQSGPRGLALIADAFPEFVARVLPFGYDWLGRQFAVDLGRIEAGQPQVMLLDPGAGEALEVPLSISTFHDEELIDYADAALAAEFFEMWSAANGRVRPLLRDQCVGYRVPLFLSGQDVVENLELGDLDVYWSICGQLRQGVLALPLGSSINAVVRDTSPGS